ncbi:MAG: helix-turn-helix transcriptional regulator [SAR324 cluster bacterium]|jgi:excisionase family DNA binding protein|nr:DNA-binding protein [Deltaproteobacteria bacterium]MDP6247661.1 helix-turn-helix transcriptional regulator [SAR324 cluster bacterium]MDP6463298.1 helix-turn-helix transcriptional regulator [SAR324 cluster bacterium]MDP6637946.1 helix-turn-helix transcriptional regulator [SAR324 cluster bacterium]MDP6728920.1 helix-turn-helix transcriptional regulator [SAR324 cluster bacterium]|tara:strand:- start:236 stop:1144 length:909 start_codon:yes stop_codon:yes gene_type:complete
MLLNTREVAEYLQLNEKKVYTLARTGKIPAVRLTGKWLFPKETLEIWLEEQARGSLQKEESPGERTKQTFGATVIAGSDDPLLHGLLQKLNDRPENGLYAFAELGSAGGIRALAAGQADLACSHLVENGEYNLPFLPRLAPGLRGTVVSVAQRSQGILVARGNPLMLKHIGDLSRSGIRVVNRQPGSGTRLLFDQFLNSVGIDPETLCGYEDEVGTHIEVAQKIFRMEADAGIACKSTADMLGLDFIELEKERFDLLLPKHPQNSPVIKLLVEALRSQNFHSRAQQLGGYDTTFSGTVQAEF